MEARNVFEHLQFFGDDSNFQPKTPPTDEPCTASDFGTWQRVAQLAARVERGEAIFHPQEEQNRQKIKSALQTVFNKGIRGYNPQGYVLTRSTDGTVY